MKSFEEIFAANNIKTPFWGKKKFEQRWNEVRFLYGQLCNEVERLKQTEAYCKSTLQKAWGAEFADKMAEMTYHEPVLRFGSYREGLDKIAEEREKVKKMSISILNWKSHIEKMARQGWIEQVISEAPPEECVVVIRGKYTPDKDNEEKFEKIAAEKKECAICMMMSPMWVVFDPQKKQDTQLWGMDRCTSTVEYILKI